jgi:hypothetical protein
VCSRHPNLGDRPERSRRGDTLGQGPLVRSCTTAGRVDGAVQIDTSLILDRPRDARRNRGALFVNFHDSCRESDRMSPSPHR